MGQPDPRGGGKRCGGAETPTIRRICGGIFRSVPAPHLVNDLPAVSITYSLISPPLSTCSAHSPILSDRPPRKPPSPSLLLLQPSSPFPTGSLPHPRISSSSSSTAWYPPLAYPTSLPTPKLSPPATPARAIGEDALAYQNQTHTKTINPNPSSTWTQGLLPSSDPATSPMMPHLNFDFDQSRSLKPVVESKKSKGTCLLSKWEIESHLRKSAGEGSIWPFVGAAVLAPAWVYPC